MAYDRVCLIIGQNSGKEYFGDLYLGSDIFLIHTRFSESQSKDQMKEIGDDSE